MSSPCNPYNPYNPYNPDNPYNPYNKAPAQVKSAKNAIEKWVQTTDNVLR